jgi:hypothetical protein
MKALSQDDDALYNNICEHVHVHVCKYVVEYVHVDSISQDDDALYNSICAHK